MMPAKRRPSEKRAYVDNYPPLASFLREHECKCGYQLPIGRDKDDPSMYVEQWQAPNGKTFLVEVRDEQRGWEVYMSAIDQSVDGTLRELADWLKH
jgi:hypothetical protein